MGILRTMEAALKNDHVPVEDYLEGEELAETKHEYVGGLVYAMAGASVDHNLIAGNVLAALRAHLKGGPCSVFMSDVKVRLKHLENDIFYYPDVMVACDPRDTEKLYRLFPKVIVEVLSKNTERLDRREKFWAYRSAETFEEYVLVAQDKREITVFRKASGWQPEVINSADGMLELKSLGFSMALAAVYEGVNDRSPGQ